MSTSLRFCGILCHPWCGRKFVRSLLGLARGGNLYRAEDSKTCGVAVKKIRASDWADLAIAEKSADGHLAADHLDRLHVMVRGAVERFPAAGAVEQ